RLSTRRRRSSTPPTTATSSATTPSRPPSTDPRSPRFTHAPRRTTEMTEPTADGTATAVESLARRLDYTEPVKPYDEINDVNGIHIVRIHREDEHLATLNLEAWRSTPVRPRGTATIYDAPNFVDYVKRLADDDTTVW